MVSPSFLESAALKIQQLRTIVLCFEDETDDEMSHEALQFFKLSVDALNTAESFMRLAGFEQASALRRP